MSTETKRGGRPRKNDSEKREHVIPFRVSEREYERLKEVAKTRKKPVTSVIRERLWMILDE